MNVENKTTPSPDMMPQQINPAEARLRTMLECADKESDLVRRVDVGGSILDELDIPQLPAGAGYYGGAARNVMELLLHDRMPPKPRDLDVCYDDYVDLYEHEYPVDYSSMPGDIDEYMNDRDFTLNQVLYVAGKNGVGSLYFTEQAAIDHALYIIRPTTFEEYDGYFGQRIFLKALRMKADYASSGIDAPIRHMDSGNIWGHRGFEEMLSLHKALEMGPETTVGYMELLIQHGYADSFDLKTLVGQLNECVYDFIFSGRAQATLERLVTREHDSSRTRGAAVLRLAQISSDVPKWELEEVV